MPRQRYIICKAYIMAPKVLYHCGIAAFLPQISYKTKRCDERRARRAAACREPTVFGARLDRGAGVPLSERAAKAARVRPLQREMSDRVCGNLGGNTEAFRPIGRRYLRLVPIFGRRAFCFFVSRRLDARRFFCGTRRRCVLLHRECKGIFA